MYKGEGWRKYRIGRVGSPASHQKRDGAGGACRSLLARGLGSMDGRFDTDVRGPPRVQLRLIKNQIGTARSIEQVDLSETGSMVCNRVDHWTQRSHAQSTRDNHDILIDKRIDGPWISVGASDTQVITDAKRFDGAGDASDGSDRVQKAAVGELGLRDVRRGAAMADCNLSGSGQMQHVELTGLESIGASQWARIEG